MRSTPVILALSSLSILFVACGPREARQEGPTRVENTELGLVLADLPARCSVARNEGTALELTCLREGVSGTVLFEVGEEERGINLVEAANAQREWFEARTGGAFFGNRELVTPGGPAYTARGRYTDEGEAIEETRVLTLHPTQSRMLIVRFRYPEAGDQVTKDRFEQLLSVVQEIKGLGGGPEGEDVEIPEQ
ncbi:MAG: hypothetical protein R3234_12705 [Thermoanaerobaculia bacterium]|nr:hypothetical protein [Thermoanaerobaculia bacterium]